MLTGKLTLVGLVYFVCIVLELQFPNRKKSSNNNSNNKSGVSNGNLPIPTQHLNNPIGLSPLS